MIKFFDFEYSGTNTSDESNIGGITKIIQKDPPFL